MSTQGPPPNASDGPSESQDSPPEGLLMCQYVFRLEMSADFLKTLEELAHAVGANRVEFNNLVFQKGIETLMSEIELFKTDNYNQEMRNLGGIGARSRKQEW